MNQSETMHQMKSQEDEAEAIAIWTTYRTLKNLSKWDHWRSSGYHLRETEEKRERMEHELNIFITVSRLESWVKDVFISVVYY